YDQLEKQKQDQAGVIRKTAIDLFNSLGEKLDNKDPLRPQALAWAGRAYSMNGQPSEAGKKFVEARASNSAVAIRLASYFEMLQAFENDQKPPPAESQALMRSATTWLTTYSNFRSTPEGFHVQYILADLYFNQGKAAQGAARDNAWNSARTYI